MTGISVYYPFRGCFLRQHCILSRLILVVAFVVFLFVGGYSHTRLPVYRQFVQARVAQDQRNHSFIQCLTQENPCKVYELLLGAKLGLRCFS